MKMNGLRHGAEVLAPLLALGVRLWFLAGFAGSALWVPVEGGHDRTLYHQAAQAIAAGALFPEGAFAHLPLYPWLLGALYALGGVHLLLAAGLGIACDTLTTWLLVRLARRLGAGGGWAVAAGVLYAFYPRAIAYAALTMPTALNTLLVTALAWGLACRSAWTFRRAVRIGLLGGLAALGYPVVLPALLLLPVVALRRGEAGRLPPVHALALLAAAALPLLPVVVHNTRAEGRLVFLSTHGGINFYMGNHERATGYPVRIRDFRMSALALQEDAHRAAEAAAGRSLGRAESSAWWSAEARRFIREHPLRAAGLYARKLRLFWSGTEVDDLRIVEQVRLAEGRFTALLWPCFALFSAAGFVGLFAARAAGPLRLLMGAAVFSVAATFLTTRYRLPVVPLLAALGAAGLPMLRGLPRVRGALLIAAALGLAAWPTRVPDARGTDHYNLSVHLLAADRPGEALRQAELGLRFDPASPDLHHARGSALFRQEAWDVAAQAFARTVAARPADRGARFNLALSLARAGEVGAARQVLRESPVPLEARAAALADTLAR